MSYTVPRRRPAVSRCGRPERAGVSSTSQEAIPSRCRTTAPTRTLGASLVMIYRHPDPATPLNAIVIYDGTFVKQQPVTLSQRIEGFYDPANVPGQITYIAGSAQSSLGEVLSVDTDGDAATRPVSTPNLFDGAVGSAWDNVTHRRRRSRDRPRPAVFSTPRLRPDTTGPGQRLPVDGGHDLSDPGQRRRSAMACSTSGNPPRCRCWIRRATALPNFKAMGARSRTQGRLHRSRSHAGASQARRMAPTAAPMRESLHSVTDAFGHLHMPHAGGSEDAGRRVRDAQGIRLHFDVGHPARITR